MKIIIWALGIPGLILLLIGLASGDPSALIGGLVLITPAAFIGIRAVRTLTSDQVMESWSALIEGGKGRSEQVLGETRDFIETSEAPYLTMEKRQIAPGFAAGLLGRTREFLVIGEDGNPKLDPYEMFLNCRDYGNNLDVNWYVTYTPSMWQAFMALLPFSKEIQEAWRELDLFDQQDLRAYTTNAHRCMLRAVDALMLSLEQDPGKIERRSRGFLGIS